MKTPAKKIIYSSLMLGLFVLFSSANTWADNIAESNQITNVSNTSNNDNQAVETNVANDNNSQKTNPTDNSSVATHSENTNNNTSNSGTISKQNQDAIGNMLLQSVSLMGIAYKWGGNTPNTGMDCSGFVRYVFQKSLGINLPRTAAEMAKVGKRISPDQLQPGDLIFFNTRRGSNTHIGIYLGGNKFIQSPRTGENIQISDLSGYWMQHFNGAKRVVQEEQDQSGNADLQNFQNVRDQALPVAARARGGSNCTSRRGRHGKVIYHCSNRSSTKVVRGTKAKATKSSNNAKIVKSNNRKVTAKVVVKAKSRKKKAH